MMGWECQGLLSAEALPPGEAWTFLTALQSDEGLCLGSSPFSFLPLSRTPIICFSTDLSVLAPLLPGWLQGCPSLSGVF